MAKAKVFEGRVRIETTLTDTDIRKADSLEPDALVLRDKNDELIFIVTTDKETCASKYGVTVHNGKATTHYSVNDEGKMTEKDTWELNGILSKLTKVEQQVAAIEYPEIEIEDLN